MTGYVKLFQSMLHSTVWREPDHVRLVWIAMLLLSDRNGIVEASVPGLADAARVSLENCEDALTCLSSPDKYSRTPNFEGRRIEKCDGGWVILNLEKYRERQSKEYQRDKWREQKRRQREAKKVSAQNEDMSAPCPPLSTVVLPCPPIADAEADPDPEADLKKKESPASVDKKPKRTGPQPKTLEIAERFAQFMADEMLKVTPDAKGLRPKKWVAELEKMFRIHKRDPKEAAHLFRWTANDSFWASNVRCGKSFREQYDRLKIRFTAEKAKENRSPGDNRERVPVPVPSGLVVPQGLTVKEAIDLAASNGADEATVRRWRYEYTQAVTEIRERGEVPNE